MIKIHKGREPQTLTEYRTSISKKCRGDKAAYEDFKEKDKEGCQSKEKGNLRRQLLEEQGYVCCYCLSQIGCDKSKIEHFKPQSEYGELRIDYKNLFISCSGKSILTHFGKPKKQFHCDTKKSNKELSSVDLLSHVENSISYERTGRIFSNNQDLDEEINKILNLNCSVLVDNREAALSYLSEEMKNGKPKKEDWSVSYLRKFLNKCSQKTKKDKYVPYYAMLVYFIQKRMDRL